MNIYYLTQNIHRGYDTFDSCVVIAESEEAAKQIHPGGNLYSGFDSATWANKPEDIKCELIGVANKKQNKGVVCSSFNAG